MDNSDFSAFQSRVKALGGIWASDNVLFAQMRTVFTAGYCPAYPNPSAEDSSIYYDWLSNQWSGKGPHIPRKTT